jgi:hypothetical protein
MSPSDEREKPFARKFTKARRSRDGRTVRPLRASDAVAARLAWELRLLRAFAVQPLLRQ